MAAVALSSPRISLIIPAFNEEKYLPQLLESVKVAREKYELGDDAIEIIVADNASTDTTSEIAKRYGCRVVAVEKRKIAAARNGGAQIANGEILAFVDADTLLHPDTFNAIEQTMASGSVVVGATGVTFDRMSFGISVTLVVLRMLMYSLGIDSGVVFCRRKDFQAIGGYNENRQYSEDVQFIKDLRRLGRGRRQHFARAKDVKTITSTRKFDLYGEWHYLVGAFIKLPFFLLFSTKGLAKWVRQYWYDDREEK